MGRASALVIMSGSSLALEDERRPEPARRAHREQRVLALAAVELAQRLQDHPRARRAERVAERDRPAVHVELRGIDLAERLGPAELLLGERLRGERLEVREHLG